MPVLHSTKNLTIVEPPTPIRAGIGIFEYTDHYTVFHYGRMPDPIPGKGEATCRMAVFNFMMLEAAGVPTHFRRFIAPNRIEFDLVQVPDPDSGRPAPGTPNSLVPVQVLFRNAVPAGSSVHRRLAAGTLTPAEAGLRTAPAIGQTLEQPLLEYATMLEPVNRYVDRAEAQRLAGVSDEQFHTVDHVTRKVNDILTAHAREVGLNHCDGKLEFLMTSDGGIVVADSPGTPDESRLTCNGVHCGKQVLRDWYVAHQLEVPVNQLIADGVPRHQWPQPAPLPPAFLPVMSDLYRALSETWTGERRWDAPNLHAAAHAVHSLVR